MTMFRTASRAAVLIALTLAALIVGAAAPAQARSVVDSAGRRVEVPDSIRRVFASGPPAGILLYVVAPEKMIGWGRAPRDEDKPFLLPSTREMAELGRLTGRGDTISTERLMASRPDLIVDFGSTNETYGSLADRIQAQTGIPYVLIDGRFQNTAAALRLFAEILGVSERGEALARAAEAIFARVDRVVATVPAADRPRVYLARGNDGFETGSRGSINTEIIERVGGVNVVEGVRDAGGIARVSPEQVIGWAPDTIITTDPAVRRLILERPEWRGIPAVQKRRVFLAPNQPFGTIDLPPSVNRLIGLSILVHAFYPDRVASDLNAELREFYRLFYQVDVPDAEIARLLQGLGH
ncbi:iron ABC transporter substrate-binding protein [Rhodopseudomonas palustris]|uniref:Periplasmic binding protein n=1 Tax=Rhodopseudomonas palustris (strain BisB18) TaxID=316056 RepID=Q216Z4_RHOPB